MGSEARTVRRAVGRGALRQDPRVMAAVALGGALGAPARYGISLAVHVSPGSFPWGTFWTNVSGSFALGFFLALVLERFPPTRYLRPFVATGFLGAFTTYSTFAVETDLLVRNGRVGVAVAYVVASFGAGLTAAWVGAELARAAGWRRRQR
jgi:fluoride exporter